MSRFSKQFAVSALAAAVIFALNACSSNSSGGDASVAATVNGKSILMSEVEILINQQMQGQQTKLGPVQLTQARLQVLDSLIQKEVLFQRAEKENLKPSEDEISQFINAKKQEGGMTEEEFQKQLKDTGQTEQSLREETRKALSIQKLQAKYTGSVSISDREVEDYYNNNREAFTLGRGVELAVIVADPHDNGLQDDAKSDSEAKSKIDAIYQQLKTGNSAFADIARARSEDPSNARGGDIGFATEDDLKQHGFSASLIARLFGPMQTGDFTEPIEMNGKYYIFKLTRKQLQTENRTLESQGVRPEITETLRNQHQQILNAALLEVAMREAKIVNNFAADLLSNPSNLGLRPASSQAAPARSATPAATSNASPAAKPATSETRPPAAPAKPVSSPVKAASPTKK